MQLAGCSRNEAQALAAAKDRIEKKEDAAAEIDLKNLLQKFPKSGEARFLLGQQFQKRGDGAAALIELQRALDLNYPDSIVMPAIARTLIGQGKTRQVIDEFSNTTFADAVATGELQALVAQALITEGDAGEASALIDKALSGAPTSEPALLTKASLEAQAGRSDQALAVLDRLIAARPNSHLAWNMKGNVLGLTPNQVDLAIAAFRKALTIRPGDVAARTGLVALTLQKGDIEGARKELDLLRKVAPKQINTKFHEANLAYATGRYTEAQSIYQTVLKVLPLNPEVLLNAAETELKLNATAQAETMAAKTLTQFPDSLRARQVLAQVYLRKGQPAKASATLSSLVDSPRATPELLALAAQAHLMNGNAAAADQMYARMAKLKPSDPRLRTLIASSGFGKVSDETVFAQLQQIAKDDAGGSADMAIVAAHSMRGQFDAALTALSALDLKSPNDPSVHHLRGQVQARKKDNQASRASFTAALKINPAYFPSAAALAALDLQDGNDESARQRFTDLLKSEPSNARAMLALSELLSRQGADRVEVLKHIDAAVKAAPTDIDARAALITHYLSGNNLDAALTAATAATTALPDSIDLLKLLASSQLRSKQFSQALSTFGKVTSLQPRSPAGYVGAADVYIATLQYDEAQRSVGRALELSPGLPEAQAQGVLLAMRRNQPEAAITIARSLQTDHPERALGFTLEGEVESKRGRLDAAIAALRKAIGKSGDGAAAVMLHQVLQRNSMSVEANAFVVQWLNSHPKDTGFIFSVGDTAHARGDIVGAAQRYEQVLALDASHVPSLNNLAMLKLQQKLPGALPLAERAVNGAPDQPAVLDTLAMAFAAEENPRKAVQTQRRAVALSPDSPNLRLNLARLLIQAGDKAQAKTELQALAKLGKQFAQQDEVVRLIESLRATSLTP